MLLTPGGWRALLWFAALRAGLAVIWSGPALRLPAAMVAGLLVADLIVLALQLVHLRRHLQGNPAAVLTMQLAAIALGAVVVLHGIDTLALAYRSPTPERQAAAQLPVLAQTVIFEGNIDLAAYNALAETLRLQPNVAALRLQSNGGNIPAARGMARLVAEHRLRTEVAGTCASACTLIFIAGTGRLLGPEGRLGFHGYRLERGGTGIDTGAEQARDRAAMLARGVAAGFLDRAFATPPDQMWFPDTTTLRQAGVLAEQ